jgi:hypothetical protein
MEQSNFVAGGTWGWLSVTVSLFLLSYVLLAMQGGNL